MRSKAQTLQVIEDSAKLITEKEKTALGTSYGLRFTAYPLLDVDIDLHRYLHVYIYYHFHTPTFRSTPVETLNTVLLRPYKYLLRQNVRNEVQAMVSSFNFSGISVKNWH